MATLLPTIMKTKWMLWEKFEYGFTHYFNEKNFSILLILSAECDEVYKP